MHEQIINFCAGRVADIPLFLKWWDEQGSGRSLSVEQGETTIEITTIHKAKGLEKKVVLIPYCNWTLNPKSSGLSANIVWAEGTDGELEEIGRFPVRYKTSMSESLFSADYYREMIYAHVDNINLLYVALTRAVESLHIFIPQKGAKGPNVGQLILQNIAPANGTVRLDGLEGSYFRDEAAETYEFGEFAGPEPDTHREAKAAHVLLGDYPTSEPQLQLRLPTERYYEEEGRAELTPRDFGILMHRVFENAATTDEIYTAIEAMTQDGVLDEKEAPRLRELVEKALADPVTAEWFGGRWQVVRNENEIILPGSGTTRRPDRVMTDGEPLTAANRRRWQNAVGYVSQHVFLLDGTLLENIALGEEEEKIDRRRAEESLRAARLEDFVQSLSAGIDTPIGEAGNKLSGGQRQRIGIARALYKQANILFFDEATSALDSGTEEGINRSIAELSQHNRDLTIVVIAHRESSLEYCDRIITLDNNG